jgi:Ca2+-binding EF-hand superfamily protein
MRRVLLAAATAALALAWPAAGADRPPPPADDRDAFDVVFLDEARPLLLRLHVRLGGRPLRAAWDDFVDKLFRHLDTDGDGVLSRAEAKHVPPPQVLNNGFAGGTVRFEEMDANHDGKVTRRELAHFFRTHGVPPLEFHFGDGSPMGSYYRLFLSSQSPPLSGQDVNRLLFDFLDANHDGKLSREELASGPERLRKLDADDDEMITGEELNPAHVPGGEGSATAFAISLDGNFPGGSTGPFVQLEPGEASKELARRLLQQYGTHGKTPATKLSRKQLSLDEATFVRLDADGDGLLDAEELARFTRRPADVELSVDVDRPRSGAPRAALVRRAGSRVPADARFGTTPGGGMRLEIGATRIEFGDPPAGGVEVATTISVAGTESGSQLLMMFRQADTDKNGYLDRNEARRHPTFRFLFDLMDRDGDGKLYEKEVVAYLETVKDLQQAAAAGRVTMHVQPKGSGLFDLLDTDHDHRLSVRELRQMPRLIAQLDRDGDGMVSRGEVPRTFGVNFQPAGAPGVFFVQTFAFVSDGGAQATPLPPEPTKGPLWFRKMDRNRDGDVSRREFLGTDAEFRRIDADGDGLISLEEATRADRWFRKKK